LGVLGISGVLRVSAGVSIWTQYSADQISVFVCPWYAVSVSFLFTNHSDMWLTDSKP
jgi:hypothetical protein